MQLCLHGNGCHGSMACSVAAEDRRGNDGTAQNGGVFIQRLYQQKHRRVQIYFIYTVNACMTAQTSQNVLYLHSERVYDSTDESEFTLFTQETRV